MSIVFGIGADGVVINKNHRTLYILEFKWSSDRNEGFLRVREDEADKQHKSIIEALKAAATEWTFERIRFVAGRRGAVVEDDFYNKLEKLNVQAGKRDKIMLAHVQRICEAHDTVMRSYYQQIFGRLGLTRRRRWRTLENKCSVNNSQSFCQQLLKKGEHGAKPE